MKKLYFLLPIVMWIADYFIWQMSIPHLNGKDAMAIWWSLTDIFSGMILIPLTIFAFWKNDIN